MSSKNGQPNGRVNGKLLGGCTGKGFMPGQSGNPKGGKKGHTLAVRLAAYMDLPDPDDPDGRKRSQVLYDNLYAAATNAKKKDTFAAKLILDRTDPATQKVDATISTQAVNDWIKDMQINREAAISGLDGST